MGEIHIDLFSTLDLVGQAPGDPGEDPDGFPFGGWQAPMFDDVVGHEVGAGLTGMEALLLGRRTYDIFAAFWPNQEDGVDGGIATLLNSVPKYVASRGTPALDWAGSEQLEPDLVSGVRELRERHAKVHVIGSLDLVQTLLHERLFDRLNLWVFPIVLGVGKRIFAGGEVPTNLTLAERPIVSTKGALLLRYALADGVPGAGDMRLADRGV
jgi:dihydrofolate reductase